MENKVNIEKKDLAMLLTDAKILEVITDPTQYITIGYLANILNYLFKEDEIDEEVLHQWLEDMGFELFEVSEDKYIIDSLSALKVIHYYSTNPPKQILDKWENLFEEEELWN